MAKWKITPISVSVHLDTDNPIFGETATQVSLDDEAAGAIICLQQIHDNTEKGLVKVDIEELELILKAAKELVSKYPKD